MAGVPVGWRSGIRTSVQTDSVCEASFELIEVLRIDLLGLVHKGFHLRGHLSLDLQLLHVRDALSEGVLPEEVANQDLLDVGLLAETGASLGESTGHGAVSVVRFSQTEGLDCIHFR